jgi:SnoaL-like domain
MTATRSRNSRRDFFLQGGAAMGAGMATAVGATGAADPSRPSTAAEQQLALWQAREAIRQLHLAYAGLMESQRFEAAVDLFAERAELQLSGACATGKPAIRQLLTEQYRQPTAPTLHCAYRPNPQQALDTLTVSDNGLEATATLHVDVALGTALQGDSTIAQMARLQGQLADRRWESGIIDAKYVQTDGQWQIAALRYRAS